MSEILRHDFRGDLEIRGDGRTVYGLAVPYDSPTRIRENGAAYEEVFRMGAFADVVADPAAFHRVKFLMNHDRKALLGPATMLREDSAGLVGEFRVADTATGAEALELIRTQTLDAFSVGFVPKLDRGTPEEGFVERVKAKLIEVSAVAFPAYELATIGGVRNLNDGERDQPADERDQLEDERDQLMSDPTIADRRRLYFDMKGISLR